jgi:hypothetical protein
MESGKWKKKDAECGRKESGIFPLPSSFAIG